MTNLQSQGQRIARLEQHLEDHLSSCEAAQAMTLSAIKDLATEVKALKTELGGLIALKNRGLGAAFALSLFGALIIMGVVAFIKDVVK